jgi:Mrp family chromosome partitioning ATPase
MSGDKAKKSEISGLTPLHLHLAQKNKLGQTSSEKGKIVALSDPFSPMSEQYRLLFSKVDRICQASGKAVIALTSSVKGEGKTTTISNLAVVAARDFKKRCLLIDADFKNPSIGKAFQIQQELGLVDFMQNRCTLDSILWTSPIRDLTILPVGHVSSREEMVPKLEGLTEILSKVRGQYYNVLWDESQGDFLQMSRQDIATYDYVFIDTPPLGPVFDMNLISEVVDGIIFVVRAGEAPKRMITKAFNLLDKSKVIGTVLNCANMPWANKYGYYSYY